jgi:nucleolar protein 56
MCPKLLKTVWFGCFVLDGEDIVDKVLFEPDPKSIAKRLAAISNDQILDEEKTLIERHTPQYTSEERLKHFGLSVEQTSWTPNPSDFGFGSDLLAKASRFAGTLKTKESTTPDMYIIQALESFDTLLEVKNLILERLRNYYSLHWPELVDRLPESRFVKLISKHGDMDSIKSSGESDLPPQDLASSISEGDVATLKELAGLLEVLNGHIESLEAHIGRGMEETAPNLVAVAGPLVGARLISLAGNLEKLSRLPSSTVQILGAEKAMFRSKKEHTKKPKHGVIFIHPLIRTAPYWRRGNIARAMAGKASIAAKVDFHKGEFIGETLRSELEKKVRSINERYPKAPTRKS